MGRRTMMNTITSPRKVAKINPENIQLMNDYLTYLASTKRSPGTIKVYKNDLLIVFVFMLEHCSNRSFITIKKRDIVALQNWMINENGNGSARVRRIKSTLSSFSDYIESILDDEYPDFKNIIHKIENPVAQPVREKSVFTDEELDAILQHLVEDDEFEKACMVALARYSGRRKAELILYKVDYFKPENIVFGSLYKTPEKIKTKGRGDGKYMYCYTLVKEFKPYLDMWMADREKKGIESEWLFPNPVNPSEHIALTTMNSWANYIGRFSKKPFYFHALRHHYVTYLSQAGLPESVVSNIMGWDGTAMVSVYNDTSAEDEIAKYFDEGGIKSRAPVTISDL